MKKFLITGGTGFIGSRLLHSLADSENEIILLSRQRHKYHQTIICDLTSEEITGDLIQSVDTIFHLAGYAHNMADDTSSAILHRKINYEATVKLARIAAKENVNQFIFLSSVKAGVAPNSGKCLSEADKSIPRGAYGRAKKEAEIKLLEIADCSNMKVKIIRSSLVYGKGVKGNLALMKGAIRKGWFPPIPEFGNKRSMIHVDDLTEALILVAKNDEANGEIFFATDGEQYSSCEIYEILCTSLGKTIPKWRIPKLIFNLLNFASLNTRMKIEKLMISECYSSKKLESIGFKARYSFRDINEKII